MQKLNMDDKISIYGKVDNIGINIENKKVCEIVKVFYKILLKKKLNLDKIKRFNIKKIMIGNNEIDKKTLFYLRGYANNKDADDSSMRFYFNLSFLEIRKLYKELKNLYTDYFCYYEKDINKLDIVIEKLFLDN